MGGLQNGTTLTKTDRNSLIKLNLNVLCDPAILILGIYPTEMKTSLYTNPGTQVCIAALFIITKDWE